MAQFNKDLVIKIADVAKLALSDEEAEEMTDHLRSFMNYADKLNELNTDDVKPTTHVNHEQNVLRRDEAKQSLTQEEALNNAPDQQEGQFKVPSILE